MPAKSKPRKGRKRLRRSESFLGIHFDFHAGMDCTEVGRDVTPKMIEDICRSVKPDYIQCDCKGHPGISSYPTKVGNPAPGFVRDQLRIWRDVTAEYGVALYMHYSGVIDNEACKQHPGWARIGPDGTPDDGVDKRHATSVFGPYVDELLIPQFKELADEYDVDGVWVDGECWGSEMDYCQKVVDEFRASTGMNELPKEFGDPGYYEFAEICREGFRKYLDYYVRRMHEHAPNFQIASNWAYTHFMPERVTVPVDFISGDYSMSNSINAARLAARVMVRQGKPWDLMAWSFVSRWQEGAASTKTVPQLCQEAAIVLALGGGFQAYFKQKRDGSIYPWTTDLMSQTAKFCRARQQLCHGAELVPQVGVVLSTESLYRNSQDLFRPWHGELVNVEGALQCLLDNQLVVEVVMEHTLEGRIDEYPLLVVPEWSQLQPGLKEELKAYAKRGGSLLIIGPGTVQEFAEELDITFEGDAAEKPVHLAHDDRLSGIKTECQRAVLGEGTKQFGTLYMQNDYAGENWPAASVAKLGKGQIAGVYFRLAERYLKAATTGLRDFLGALARKLAPRQMVEVSGSRNVDVSLALKDGTLIVNLVNTGGPHADENVYTFDDIPPIGPLELDVRLPRDMKKPKRVKLEPSGQKLKTQVKGNVLRVSVPSVEIHEIVTIE